MYLLVFTLLISLYIVHQLFPAPILSYFVGLLAAASLTISFKKASGLYLKTGAYVSHDWIGLILLIRPAIAHVFSSLSFHARLAFSIFHAAIYSFSHTCWTFRYTIK